MSMDLRDLRSFLAVVRTGSFTAAAADLGYTQSAVSQHVAALEADLGTPLLHRRPVRPTAAGARLAEHAARIVLRVDVARSELARAEADPTVVRVAASPLAAPRVLAAALRDLRAAAPAVGVVVEAVGPTDAVSHLATGRVDVAVVDGVVAPDSPLSLVEAGMLTATVVTQEPLAVAVPVGHPLARRARIDLDIVIDAPWIDSRARAIGAGVAALRRQRRVDAGGPGGRRPRAGPAAPLGVRRHRRHRGRAVGRAVAGAPHRAAHPAQPVGRRGAVGRLRTRPGAQLMSWPTVWITRPARPPTTVPLMRMNCRSRPICCSMRVEVSWASHLRTVDEMRSATSWRYCSTT